MTPTRTLLNTFLAAGAVTAVALWASCGFTVRYITALPLCETFDEVGLTEVQGGPPALVFETPGTVVVLHGLGHAKRTSGRFIKVEQSADLPAYANRAAVFLNGWRADYAGDDHHVYGVGTMIARIEVLPGKVRWKAAGGLGDTSGSGVSTWSYAYTIVAWNDANLHAMIDQNDEEFYCKQQGADASDNFFEARNRNMTTALATYASFLQHPGFATGRSVAVLPRGYGFAWDTHGDDDHHLLQLAYRLESVAPYVSYQGYRKAFDTLRPLATPHTAVTGAGYVSWKTSVLFKDNARRRNFEFAEVVSGMGGPDVDILQPQFSILPFEPADGGFGGSGLKSAEVVIENLPYECAVPMLTGWEIGYALSDQHVRELGIWIDQIRYVRPAGAPVGTLRYRIFSVLRDNDDFPDNYYAHQVTVLGLRPIATADRGK